MQNYLNLEVSTRVSVIGYNNHLVHLLEQSKIKFSICDTRVRLGKFNCFMRLTDMIRSNEVYSDTHIYYVFASDLDNVLTELNNLVTKNSYVIINNTTNKKFNNIHLVYSPTIYSEGILTIPYILFGAINNCDMHPILSFYKNYLYNHNNNFKIIIKPYSECDLFSHALNNFMETKNTYYKNIHSLCETRQVDYNSLCDLFKLEPTWNTIPDENTIKQKTD